MRIPETLKQVNKTRRNIIKNHLDNNFRRFLRKHYKQHLNPFVYYKYIRPWKKSKENKRLAISLLKGIGTPRNVCAIVNIMITLKKHYGGDYNESTALLAKKIWDYFDHDITIYVDEKYRKLGFKGPIDKNKAFKEQKARGFIHINDFEDYDNRFGYLFSNVDFDYVLPIPFYHNKHKDYHLSLYDVYHGQYLYGVENWTRVQLPGKMGMAK